MRKTRCERTGKATMKTATMPDNTYLSFPDIQRSGVISVTRIELELWRKGKYIRTYHAGGASPVRYKLADIIECMDRLAAGKRLVRHDGAE
jgi:hypothetical protein